MKFSWHLLAIKLTSRKLWISFAGLAASVMAYMKCDSNTIVQVTAVIGASGSIVGYLVANESRDDIPHEKNKIKNTVEHGETDEDDST